jgi:hypothetical protein
MTVPPPTVIVTRISAETVLGFPSTAAPTTAKAMANALICLFCIDWTPDGDHHDKE